MIENLSAIEIGCRIQEKLKEKGWKQKDLCNSTNLSKNAISNYVSGNRIPDTTSIYKISLSLNVSIEWLLTGVDLIKSADSINKEENELIGLFNKCDEIYKDDILSEIYSLLSAKDYDFRKSTNELTDNELKIIELYRSLNTTDKIKIEGIIELKIRESKKEMSSTYQNGEEAVALDKELA